MKKKSKEIKAPKVKPLPMIRVNTRITQSQHKFIKMTAKKTEQTEGEVFRGIIKEHIDFHK